MGAAGLFRRGDVRCLRPESAGGQRLTAEDSRQCFRARGGGKRGRRTPGLRLRSCKHLVGGMRIAVFADTHNRYPASLPACFAGADEIWHLGDVCSPGVLAKFEALGRPMRVVQGNNDSDPRWPLVLELEREGVRFHLEHIPPVRPRWGCHAVLHGHTHVPRDETIDGIRWLNPGCVSRPNRGSPPSYAWLTVVRGEELQWKVMRL